MPESALFAYVVCVQLATTAAESVCEISAELIPLDDDKPIDNACDLAIQELRDKYGAAAVAGAKILRVHQVNISRELVRGDPTDEDIAEAEAAVEAEAEAEREAAAAAPHPADERAGSWPTEADEAATESKPRGKGRRRGA